MKMPFGKYQDVELTDVPRHYLLWLRRQNWLGAWLAEKIDAILSGENQQPEKALKKWKPGENE